MILKNGLRLKKKNSLPYVVPLPQDELATPNEGATLLNYQGNPEVGYPVVIEENGYVGKAAKLITRDARESLAALLIPTSVSFFVFCCRQYLL